MKKEGLWKDVIRSKHGEEEGVGPRGGGGGGGGGRFWLGGGGMLFPTSCPLWWETSKG